MNILVIGNGFDLAHGLPTGYKDFLRFTNEYLDYKKTVVEGGGQLSWDDQDDVRFYKYFIELYNNRDNVIEKRIIDELNTYIPSNSWLDHFNRVQISQNWIDFESEISRVIQVLDSEIQFVKAEEKTGEISKDMCRYVQRTLGVFEFDNSGSLVERLKRVKEQCIMDLDKLIRCLEIYLSHYINNVEINKKRQPDIAELPIDCVLSFNYTNTYERIYNPTGERPIKYDYIHGKADVNKDINNCNLVLGIDEYLSEKEKNINTELIQFKKFYQRIYKMTGCMYKEWIEQRIESVRRLPNPGDLNIYFFGHSLDITDGDVLRELINMDNAKTTIFYHDKETLGKQIANLVKVLGQDNLIARVHGIHPSIVFKQQQNV